jgi:transcriptional regulator of NAD metabolism
MARKYDSYLRDLAQEYRKLAEQTGSEDTKQELLGLAAVCEEVANNVEDHPVIGYDANAFRAKKAG